MTDHRPHAAVLPILCSACDAPVSVTYEPRPGVEENVWTCPACDQANHLRMAGSVVNVTPRVPRRA